MIALDIMLLALAQSSVSAPAPGAAPAPRPDVEVIGPAQQNRMICRVISMSNSRIPTRRICQTQAQLEEARDRAQAEGAEDARSTMRRTAEMLIRSGPRMPTPSETSVGQTRRGGD
jgi:hypothetical protein